MRGDGLDMAGEGGWVSVVTFSGIGNTESRAGLEEWVGLACSCWVHFHLTAQGKCLPFFHPNSSQ